MVIGIDSYILSFSFPFLLLLPLILIILKHIKSPSSSKQQLPLPPGPKPWPIVGNLLQIGQNAHISTTQFAQIYGPLLSLKLGAQRLVVASSPAAAAAILKTQDRLLSARYIFQMTPDRTLHDDSSLVFSPECNERWRSLRSVCRANLFAAKAIESQADLRRRKMNEMVEFLQSKQGGSSVVEIKDFVFTTVFNTLSNFIFSRDLLGFVGDGFNGIKGPFKNMMDLGLTPNLADFYPLLQSFDLQGLKKKAAFYKEQVDSSWEILSQERRKIISQQNSLPSRDFLDVLIESGFTDHQIHYLIVEVLSAGTDTTTTTVEWAMTELLKNKDIMKKVQEEMKKVTNGSKIDESNVSQLHYLWKCVKETLRLHPPAPFLLPRVAPQACEVMGYTIPKDTLIFINVWGIGRDPLVWEDSLSFNPERFVDCDVDFKGSDYRYLPFGGGRRICPGIPMAIVQVPLILATLIHNFEWSLPNGEDLSKLDLNGRLGVTLQKEKPLKLIPKRRIDT